MLLRHTFSAAGAAQLSGDVQHCGVANISLDVAGDGQGDAERSFKKLNEGLFLLCLNAGPVSESPESTAVHFDGRKDGDDDGGGGGGDVTSLGLWDVEKMVFKDNESARDVLSEVGIDILT